MTISARKDAMKMGASRYFTGKLCPHGHTSERYVKTMQCVACVSEYRAAWTARNPTETKAINKAYRQRNPEKAKAWKSDSQKRNRASANARQRRYVENNREAVYARSEAWAKANPAKVTASTRRYQADRLQRTPPWANHDHILGMYELAVLFRNAGLDVEVDHEVPLRGRKVSGLHVAENLQLIHSTANKSKSNHFQGVSP